VLESGTPFVHPVTGRLYFWTYASVDQHPRAYLKQDKISQVFSRIDAKPVMHSDDKLDFFRATVSLGAVSFETRPTNL
jgi:hypothetical protein